MDNRLKTLTKLTLILALSAGLMLSQPAAVKAFQDTAARHAALCDSGFVRLERGNVEDARELFEQVLRIDNKYPRALLGMGRVMLETRAGGERAIDYLRQATELLPTNIAARYYRALAHLKLADTDFGRDNAIMAREQLQMTLDLDPSHPDAHFRMGLLLRDIFHEFEEAESEFEKQIMVNPGHLDARYELLRAQMDLGKWDTAVTTAEALLARDPDYLNAYPYLAGAHWKAERYEESMGIFERYFPLLSEEEIGLYLDLALVLNTDEKEELLQLNQNGRRAFWAHYWRTRDPDPKTSVNERLLEHYIRVAYARIVFGADSWPWDERGNFYVRYGEPDYRSGRGMPVAWQLIDDDPEWIRRKRQFQERMGLSTLLLETSVFEAAHWDVPGHLDKRPVITIAESLRVVEPTWSLQDVWDYAVEESEKRQFRAGSEATRERWVYATEGIDLNFEDFTHNGAFNVWGMRSRIVVERMEEKLPTLSPEEDKIERIDPMDSVVTFRGEEGRTIVEYAFALLPDEFGAFRSVTGAYATLDVEVNLFTEQWELIAGEDQEARRLETIPQVQIRGIPLFVDATRMEVAPGTYRLTTLLMDPESGKRATAEEIVELPDFSGDELIVSNILPAASITQVGPGRSGTFIRGELEVLPLPGRVMQTDQPLFIYYEVYNLTKDQFGSTQYQIEYAVQEAPEERTLTSRLYHGLRALMGRGRGRTGVASTVTQSGISDDLRSYLEIDVSSLPPRTYILTLTVTDLVSGEKNSSTLIFRTLPPVG